MSVRTALWLSRRSLCAFAQIGICWGTFAATVPAIKAQIGASDALFGILLLASAAGLLSSAVVAPWADARFGRLALPLAAGVYLLAFPLLGWVGTPLAFAGAMVLIGAASGVTDVISNARVSDMEAHHRRPLMNFNHAVFSFAYAIAAVAAGIGREAGLSPAVILLLPALACAFLLPLLAIPPGDDAHGQDGAVPTLPLWPVALCGAIVLIAFMTEAATEAWAALHVERTLGGRAAEGALGPAMLGLTMGIGRLTGHLVAERFSDIAVIRAGALLAALGALIAALAAAPPVAYLGYAVLGLGVSVVGPLGLAMVGRLVPAALRTRAIARTAVIGFSGFFLAPPLMGITAEFLGLRAAFAAVALFVLVVPVLTVLHAPRLRTTLSVGRGI